MALLIQMIAEWVDLDPATDAASDAEARTDRWLFYMSGNDRPLVLGSWGLF
jgi:hypothetical protein